VHIIGVNPRWNRDFSDTFGVAMLVLALYRGYRYQCFLLDETLSIRHKK
jgi:hypothetical protein